jgi:mRNA interferase MazF
VVARYIPDRGDIVWLQFSPQAGHEQAGHRPALIVSSKAYNQKVGLALACPLTSKVKGYPFEVSLPEGLPAKGAILADQIKSLDWRVRKAKFFCEVPAETVEEVVGKLGAILGQ